MRRVVAVLVVAWSSIANAAPGESPVRLVGELSFDGGAFYAPQSMSREWNVLYGASASIGAEVRPRLAILAHTVFLYDGSPEPNVAIFAGAIAWYRTGHARLGGGVGVSIKGTNLGNENGNKHDLLGVAGTVKAEVVESAFALGVELNVDVLPDVDGAQFGAPWPLVMFTIGVGRY